MNELKFGLVEKVVDVFKDGDFEDVLDELCDLVNEMLDGEMNEEE